MPLSPNFTSVYSRDWELNFTHCTPNGYLKYTDLCNLLQLTAGDHADIGGISFTDMQQHNQAWVLSRMKLEIESLPKWRDIVTVKTWIVSLENSRSVRALEMHVNGKKVIGCETYWAVFNTKLRRPETLALPHEHFKKYPERLATEERVKKIDLPDSMKKIAERKVVLSDLDIVNHVNNVKYLEWCLDLVNPKSILKQQLKSFDMNFMKELVLGDEVAIDEATDTNPSIFSINKNGKPCFALKLDWK
ncbi:acyl-[acyl-carrier-protein] thioesterase [Flavobacterium lindanitolerans]|uniref:Acyl-ACP thioesterase n=1 Tax=Flavobacterium lindanitolerans TaxID=428988 RepID=A0A497UHJ0_9FLAO|nr:acyl-ACP thioesterase domain-containing protein [Flavobacterium lindanitolerans]PKW21011.1 acyl-ACP thioesterase [Flavobacterium lindanitolerans]RLJ30350.1 acyl-ACP thioesterase [Flavobacterium lindanitolerans]